MEITLNGPEDVAKELLEKYKNFKPWRAKLNQEYCFITDRGVLSSVIDNYDKIDFRRYLLGNYYKTTEEAHQAREITLAKSRLNFKMLELNKGWTPDWTDENGKYYFYYDYSTERLEVSYHNYQHVANYIFSSRELAEQFAKEMEDDLNLVFKIK